MHSSGSNAPISLKFGTVSIRFRLVDRNIVISEYAGSSSSSSLSSASFFFFCFWVNSFQAHYRPLWKNGTHCIFESIFFNYFFHLSAGEILYFFQVWLAKSICVFSRVDFTSKIVVTSHYRNSSFMQKVGRHGKRLKAKSFIFTFLFSHLWYVEKWTLPTLSVFFFLLILLNNQS